MKNSPSFIIIVAGLFIIGMAQTILRHRALDVPWLPGKTISTWDIDAKINFQAKGKPVLAKLTIPIVQNGYTQITQNGTSPGYGLSFINEVGFPQAQWSIRKATGQQTLYYHLRLSVNAKARAKPITKMPLIVEQAKSKLDTEASKAVIADAYKTSADAYSFTAELLKMLNAPDQNQNIRSLMLRQKSKIKLLASLLNQAKIANKLVGVLKLKDGRRRQHLIKMIEVYQKDANNVITRKLFAGSQVQTVDRTGLLIWDQSGQYLLDVAGGDHSKVSFAIIKQEAPALSAIIQNTKHNKFFDFSIHSLPVEDQALFKGILMIPLGVLIVVIMRILIGIKTSGTFMPVLIAMAFVQTSLITGLIGFVLLVGVGLIIRSYLSRLNLLLVARISTVIIMVILLIALFGVLSYKLGLTEGLKITFFPMIILSWTIERMSVLWEEEGAKEVFTQGGGSLLVAVFAYFAMSNHITRHLMFNFMGLQFVVMSIVLLLGSYTGYRLLELRRFKPLAEQE